MSRKKNRAEKPKHEFTQRQLSRWQQQQKRQRIVFGTGISIIAAILVIVLLGWYLNQYRPLHEIAIRVNDTEFNMQYYIERLKIDATGQSPENMASIADSTIKEIEQMELIRQAAPTMNVTLTRDEVKQGIEESGFPNDDAHWDLVSSQIIIGKLLSNYFDPQVPKTAEQVHLLAMLLESGSQASQVRARQDISENFTGLAGGLSLDNYSKTNKGDYGWHSKDALSKLSGVTAILVDSAFHAEVGTISQPIYDYDAVKGVGYWLIKVLARDEANPDHAQVQAMLLGSQEEADKIKVRLDAGEGFATLAKESSQLQQVQENGGDLGSLTKGTVNDTFDNYVFNTGTEIGKLSKSILDESVATKGGYWLIKVTGKEANRQIDESDRNLLKNSALQEWASSLWTYPGIKIDDSALDQNKKLWAIAQASKT